MRPKKTHLSSRITEYERRCLDALVDYTGETLTAAVGRSIKERAERHGLTVETPRAEPDPPPPDNVARIVQMLRERGLDADGAREVLESGKAPAELVTAVLARMEDTR